MSTAIFLQRPFLLHNNLSLSPVSIFSLISVALIIACLNSIQTNHKSAILLSSTKSFVEQHTHQKPTTTVSTENVKKSTTPLSSIPIDSSKTKTIDNIISVNRDATSIEKGLDEKRNPKIKGKSLLNRSKKPKGDNSTDRYSKIQKWLLSNNKTLPQNAVPTFNNNTAMNCSRRDSSTAANNFDSTINTKRQQQEKKKWAYAYVISGCTETSCNGYILNIIVSAWVLIHQSFNRRLHKSTSKADIVVKIRMASSSCVNRIDPYYEEMLRKANIKFDYLPKVRYDNFGTATLEKFRVLEMVEYERVLFMDADIIALCNMDYMFEQSYEGGMLSEYVAIAGSAAPATASIFLVTPKEGEFGRVMDIITRHHKRPIEPMTFYPSIGWGHRLHPNDPWKAWWRSGLQWDFYAAASDQGILYHWLRYQQLNYTQIIWSAIQQYREVDFPKNVTEINTTIFEIPDYSGQYNGRIRYIKKVNETINARRNQTLPKCGGKAWGRNGYSTIAPFADYYHFKGNTKPWGSKSTIMLNETSNIVISELSKKDSTAGQQAWQIWLAQANEALGLGLPKELQLFNNNDNNNQSSVTATAKSGNNNPLGLMDNGNDLFIPDIELPQPL